MRVCNIGLVVAAALLLACAESRPGIESDDVDPATGAAGQHAPPSTHAKCDDYQTEARQLLEAGEQCSSDGDCVIASIEGLCLWSFLCPTAVNRMEVDHLQAEARRLSTAYRSCSNVCAIASCVYGAGMPAVCNPDTKRCEVRTAASRMPEVGNDFPDASTESSDDI